MKNLYVKGNNENYIPVRLELVAPSDLANKLIVITVGDDKEEVTEYAMEQVRDVFANSEVINDAMRRSEAADLLILPSSIKLEILSKKELEAKTVCIQIDNKDKIDDLLELKVQIKKKLGKEAIILPLPISVKEYKEIKAIRERIKIRKERHGGGTGNK